MGGKKRTDGRAQEVLWAARLAPGGHHVRPLAPLGAGGSRRSDLVATCCSTNFTAMHVLCEPIDGNLAEVAQRQAGRRAGECRLAEEGRASRELRRREQRQSPARPAARDGRACPCHAPQERTATRNRRNTTP